MGWWTCFLFYCTSPDDDTKLIVLKSVDVCWLWYYGCKPKWPWRIIKIFSFKPKHSSKLWMQIPNPVWTNSKVTLVRVKAKCGEWQKPGEEASGAGSGCREQPEGTAQGDTTIWDWLQGKAGQSGKIKAQSRKSGTSRDTFLILS